MSDEDVHWRSGSVKLRGREDWATIAGRCSNDREHINHPLGWYLPFTILKYVFPFSHIISLSFLLFSNDLNIYSNNIGSAGPDLFHWNRNSNWRVYDMHERSPFKLGPTLWAVRWSSSLYDTPLRRLGPGFSSIEYIYFILQHLTQTFWYSVRLIEWHWLDRPFKHPQE